MTRSIRCGYCGDAHGSVDDVRHCASTQPPKPPRHPPAPPTISWDGPQVVVELMGYSQPCWKCSQTTTCLLGFLPPGATDPQLLMGCTSEEMLALADTVVPDAARQQFAIGEIRRRYSRTVGEAYLSNGCAHCDAIQGWFFLYDDADWHLARIGEPGGLVHLGSVTVPRALLLPRVNDPWVYAMITDPDPPAHRARRFRLVQGTNGRWAIDELDPDNPDVRRIEYLDTVDLDALEPIAQLELTPVGVGEMQAYDVTGPSGPITTWLNHQRPISKPGKDTR